jgi:hypothetical protein
MVGNGVNHNPKKLSHTVIQKKYIYFLLVRLEENVCFRCSKPIETSDEFSMDHKVRHENNPRLFWDVNNITASHFRCNVAANGASEKHWVTDGEHEKLVHKSSLLPLGWRKGRCQYVVKDGNRVKMVGENHPRYGTITNRERSQQGRYT